VGGARRRAGDGDLTVEPTDLLGPWRFERRIIGHDGANRRFGRVTGTLDLVADGGAVGWHERGTLRWDGRDLEVYRDLHVERRAEGWMVCFADGREFHPWRLAAPVTHPCRADTYCGLLAVDRERTRLRVVWDVTGPAKRHRLFTRATRTPS
jgi:hypothetical protein